MRLGAPSHEMTGAENLTHNAVQLTHRTKITA